MMLGEWGGFFDVDVMFGLDSRLRGNDKECYVWIRLWGVCVWLDVIPEKSGI
jgi:hypothetical protein